jgi:hypothetical protein
MPKNLVIPIIILGLIGVCLFLPIIPVTYIVIVNEPQTFSINKSKQIDYAGAFVLKASTNIYHSLEGNLNVTDDIAFQFSSNVPIDAYLLNFKQLVDFIMGDKNNYVKKLENVRSWDESHIQIPANGTYYFILKNDGIIDATVTSMSITKYWTEYSTMTLPVMKTINKVVTIIEFITGRYHA